MTEQANPLATKPTYTLTNQNIVVLSPGSSKNPKTGHQRHFAVFKDSTGIEFVSLPGQGMVKVSNVRYFIGAKREFVQRG